MEVLQKLTLKQFVFIILFLAAVIFTRFYNLDHTARFTRDESSDLVRMRQYYQEKKLTLVGPISSDNSKVFSSLTYYMVMPFAALTGFEPIGPVYGTAFWGVVTALVLLALAYKVNESLLLPAGLLIVTWLPLIEMSRWAWNPHFVALWAGAGLLAYYYQKKTGIAGYAILGGSFGMMFHHHYLSVVATTPILLYISFLEFRKKQHKPIIAIITGYAFALLPFLLFDLKHPPGLFFTQYLLGGNTPNVQMQLNAAVLLEHAHRNLVVLFWTFTNQQLLFIPLAIGFIALAITDACKKVTRLVWLVPLGLLLIVGLFLVDFEARYIYPSVVFVLVWLLLPRKGVAQIIRNIALSLLLLGSVLGLRQELTVTKVPPDIYSFTQASHYIADTIAKHSLVNPNIAVLASKDSAPLAEKYRDIVRMYGSGVRELNEYDATENLFVVSTSNEERVRADKSNAMVYFSESTLKESYSIDNSIWHVYWFAY